VPSAKIKQITVQIDTNPSSVKPNQHAILPPRIVVSENSLFISNFCRNSLSPLPYNCMFITQKPTSEESGITKDRKILDPL